MKVVDRQQILETLSWRYATKKFDSAKKISDSDWKVLSESLRLAPSSYGLQPWKFILVENKQVRRELTPLSWNQTQVEDCSHYVVFAARTAIDEAYADKWMKCLADTREIPVEKLAAYRELMFKDIVKGPRSKIADTWSQRQSYIAMGFLMETAALLGIDTCAMEGIDPPAYDKVLKLEGSSYKTIACVALGYRAADDKYAAAKKARFATDEVIQVIR
jgi:nitroreductase